VSVVDKAVQDGIGEGGITEDLVPLIAGDLGDDEGGFPVVAVVKDFQEGADSVGRKRSQSPVIQNQKVDAGQGLQTFTQTAVGFGDGQFRQQSGYAGVEDLDSGLAGVMGQGASQVTLSNSAWPGDETVFVTPEPLAREKGLKERAVQTAPLAKVDVLDHGGLAQLSAFEPRRQMEAGALGHFLVDE